MGKSQAVAGSKTPESLPQPLRGVVDRCSLILSDWATPQRVPVSNISWICINCPSLTVFHITLANLSWKAQNSVQSFDHSLLALWSPHPCPKPLVRPPVPHFSQQSNPSCLDSDKHCFNTFKLMGPSCHNVNPQEPQVYAFLVTGHSLTGNTGEDLKIQWETQLTQLFTESTTVHNSVLVPADPWLPLQSLPLSSCPQPYQCKSESKAKLRQKRSSQGIKRKWWDLEGRYETELWLAFVLFF